MMDELPAAVQTPHPQQAGVATVAVGCFWDEDLALVEAAFDMLRPCCGGVPLSRPDSEQAGVPTVAVGSYS